MYYRVDMSNSTPPSYAVINSNNNLDTLKQAPANCLQPTPTNLPNATKVGIQRVTCNDSGLKMKLTILSQ